MSEYGTGTPLRQGHKLVLVGTPVFPPPSVLHLFYQPGMGSRYCNGEAMALGLGPEHLGANPALSPTGSETPGKFFNLSGPLFCLKEGPKDICLVGFENCGLEWCWPQ